MNPPLTWPSTGSPISSVLYADSINLFYMSKVDPTTKKHVHFVFPRLISQALPPKHGTPATLDSTSAPADNQLVPLLSSGSHPQYSFYGRPPYQLRENGASLGLQDNCAATPQRLRKPTVCGEQVASWLSTHSDLGHYPAFNAQRTRFYLVLDNIALSIRLGSPPLAIINDICDERRINSADDAEQASELILRLVNMTHRRDGYLPPRCTSDMFTRPAAELLLKTLKRILIVVDGFESLNIFMSTQVLEVFASQTNRLYSWCRLAGLLYSKGIIGADVVYKFLATLLGARAELLARYRGAQVLLDCAGSQ
ncbi:hypothetical protein D9619_012893 [Psilocybe cf. subviscida]|uniref:Uncharacterized protein n=1 Tax=Psilocybe cf. subviscida TaxID=2480587 RepID=A0A8H5BJ30_9AGAR|nr:hypothetical protein D9619_012893 [Psilocybe cf. subviscida]